MSIHLAGLKAGRTQRQATPRAPGRFSVLEYSRQTLTAAGWLFQPGLTITGYLLKLNGVPVGKETSPQPHDGVAKMYPSVPEAQACGFLLRVALPENPVRDWVWVDVCGRAGEEEVGGIAMPYRSDFLESLPDTPVELRERVTRARAPIATYWLSGLEVFGNFYEAISTHLDRGRVRRMLDWGCGCGRVTGVMVKYLTDLEVHGCDIDRDAVEWCAGNLPLGHFATIPPHPPTAYGDEMFDVVTACSVLTHLSQELQSLWLGEMRRILAPGGLLLASVHGDFLTQSLRIPPRVKEEVRSKGISDATPDRILDGVAPETYYRTTYQSKEYTVREYARYFKILDYVELGMGNLQDLVIMQKTV
jgi:SAM-dependent methyltransferase